MNAVNHLGRPSTEILAAASCIFCISMNETRRRRVTAQASQHNLKVTFVPGIDVRCSKQCKPSARPPTTSFRTVRQNVQFDFPNIVVTSKPVKRIVSKVGRSRIVQIKPAVMSYGEIGCTIAHLLAILRFAKQGKPGTKAIIMEDDTTFELVPFWPKTLAEIIASAPAGWQLLNLSNHHEFKTIDMSRLYERAHKAGAHFYCITHEAACQLKAMVKNGRLRIENKYGQRHGLIADHFLFKLFRTFQNCAFPAVCYSDGFSSIGNKSKDSKSNNGMNVMLAHLRNITAASIVNSHELSQK